MPEKVYLNEEEAYGVLTFLSKTGEETVRGRNGQITTYYKYELNAEKFPAEKMEVVVLSRGIKTLDFGSPVKLKNSYIKAVGTKTNNYASSAYMVYAEDILPA